MDNDLAVRIGLKLADRLDRLFEHQERIMTELAKTLATAVAANATLAAAVLQLAESQGTQDADLQPILDQVNATNTALQAMLPPAPPPAA